MATTQHEPPPATSGTAVVTAYLDAQAQALAAGDRALRQGHDAIHSTRVASRRLRSTLRVFGPLFERSAAERLDEELGWYAGLLGEVRDRQVQRARFADAVTRLPPDVVAGPVADRIEHRLLPEQLLHHQILMTALTTERYDALMGTVAAWATSPPLTAKGDGDAHVLLRYVDRARHQLTKRLAAALRPGTDPEILHSARKAAKRARYAVELATPLLHPLDAKAALSTYKATQEILGEHQDSIVAAGLLGELMAEADPASSDIAFPLLYAREVTNAEQARAQAASLLPGLRRIRTPFVAIS